MGRQLRTRTFPVFWTAKNSRVNNGPLGGRLADVDVLGPSFSEVRFHRLSAPKRSYTIKTVVSALFGQCKSV